MNTEVDRINRRIGINKRVIEDLQQRNQKLQEQLERAKDLRAGDIVEHNGKRRLVVEGGVKRAVEEYYDVRTGSDCVKLTDGETSYTVPVDIVTKVGSLRDGL